MKSLLIATTLGLLTSVATGQDSSPVESRTWYVAALHRLTELDGELRPAGVSLPVSDAMLAAMVYDRLQDEAAAGVLERLGQQPFAPPADLPADSPQHGVHSFVQLGHLQVAYMPMFAKMSAQAATDLYQQASSPDAQAVYNRMALARLWVRLGETAPALTLLDPESSLHIEERCELIRQAYAAAKIDAARSLAQSTLETILGGNPDITDTRARHLSHLVTALIDCSEIEQARAAMKHMPASEDALPAWHALLKWDAAREEEPALDADVNALLEMLGQMNEFDSAQTSACVRAAELCIEMRRNAEAVRCFDRLNRLAALPDPPLTLPTTWAEAARVALYTTANDRSAGYLERCARSIAADPEAREEDRLLAELAMARVDAVGGNVASFNTRMATANPRLKTGGTFMTRIAIQNMFCELARVSRDESLVAAIRQITARNEPGGGKLAMAFAMRLQATGDPDGAWTLANSISDRNWRLRALIELAHARLQIHDEAEQLAALIDLQTHTDPREAAYLMLGVGARLSGDEGTAGDAMMRSNGLD